MKIVREHINFERGKDPQDSLKIGKYAPVSIPKKMSEVSYPYTILDDDSPEIMIQFEIEGKEFDPKDPIHYEYSFSKASDDETILFLYGTPYKGTPGGPYLDGETGLQRTIYRTSNMDAEIKELRDHAYDMIGEIDGKLLEESVSFERGEDPKEIMKIGKWHRKKIEKELRKVIEYFGEYWLETLIPQFVDELDNLGIELIDLEPYHEKKFPFHGIVKASWKNSDGKEQVYYIDVEIMLLKKNNRKNQGINILYPIVNHIKWGEHELMK